jgi:MFS family permease
MAKTSSLAPLYIAAFVLMADTAGTGHLLPGLEAATAAPARGASWLLTITMLGALLGAPLLARIASARGRTRVLAAALLAFAIASLVVGLSSRFSLTLGGRFLQGFAGASVMPLGAAHVAATMPRERKGKSLALLSLSYSAGFLSGMAFVSLFLLVSFRLAYLFTGLLAAVAAAKLARMPQAREAADADQAPPSLTTLAGWYAALVVGSFAVNQSTLDGSALASLDAIHRWTIRGTQLVALPALVLFAWRDRTAKTPLLPRDLFQSRLGIATACLAGAAGIGQASVVLLPSVGIIDLGVSPAASGPLLIPVVIGGLGANLVASARLDRWGPRRFLAAGVLAMMLGNAIIAAVGTRLVSFEIGALFLGTGVSAMSSGALRYLATIDSAAEDADARQAAVSLLTNVGILLGGSVWGAVVTTGSDATTGMMRAGLLALTTSLAPLSLALALVPRRAAVEARS